MRMDPNGSIALEKAGPKTCPECGDSYSMCCCEWSTYDPDASFALQCLADNPAPVTP